jgi:GNAT superfamily N-acetyltransferase
MEVVARAATEADLDELVALYRGFCKDLAAERGGELHLRKEGFSPLLEDHFNDVMGDGRHLVLLGTLDKVPVGLVVAELGELRDSSRLAAVDVLYVEPPAREVGVGESLLEAVANWATSNGASGIDIRVLPGMRQAKNFLEGSGFVARLLVMHRRLG